MTDDGLFVEGVGLLIVEDCARRDEGVRNGLAGGSADPELDAGRIDALFLNQVLASIERAFGGCFGLLLRRRVADHNQPGIGLLRERQSDVIEAALGFVVDAHGATDITTEGQAAELLDLRDDGDERRCDDDVGGRLGGLSEIVDDVAGNRDRAGA